MTDSSDADRRAERARRQEARRALEAGEILFRLLERRRSEHQIAGKGAFLGKPFTPAELARTVREVIDTPS